MGQIIYQLNQLSHCWVRSLVFVLEVRCITNFRDAQRWAYQLYLQGTHSQPPDHPPNQSSSHYCRLTRKVWKFHWGNESKILKGVYLGAILNPTVWSVFTNWMYLIETYYISTKQPGVCILNTLPLDYTPRTEGACRGYMGLIDLSLKCVRWNRLLHLLKYNELYISVGVKQLLHPLKSAKISSKCRKLDQLMRFVLNEAWTIQWKVNFWHSHLLKYNEFYFLVGVKQ